MTIREAYDRYKDAETIIYAERHTASCLSGTHLLIRDLWHAIKAEVEKHDTTRSLLDGCYNLVEIWKPESPAQEEWKRRWLKYAREVIDAEG